VTVMNPDQCLVCDQVRLTQVISNLLNNATRYSPQGGVIWLNASLQGEHVVISVRDNGMGIDASMLTRIWDLFVQAGRGSQEAQGGLGIGLTLVRSLVKLHGGTVDAQSS